MKSMNLFLSMVAVLSVVAAVTSANAQKSISAYDTEAPSISSISGNDYPNAKRVENQSECEEALNKLCEVKNRDMAGCFFKKPAPGGVIKRRCKTGVETILRHGDPVITD